MNDDASGQGDEEEKVIMQEDCNEDELGSGYLTLTNQRLIFQKGESRVLTLSKKMTELVLDIPLKKIVDVGTEGLLAKKVLVEVAEPQKAVYKFGVFNTGKWRKTIGEAAKLRSGS